ncbi:uncharacterized protein LOC125072953 [Vanessa atalanta]|uniref:uncharacterized protein LOC125072953 n=1 Tax=Vanessa atalanta TaxID=42275 RepID=UPI001FCD2DCC|nr:uncharacterized protein LOC125072953 [Vanessa atalanta]
MRLPFTSKPLLTSLSTKILDRFQTPLSPEMTDQVKILLKQRVLEVLQLQSRVLARSSMKEMNLQATVMKDLKWWINTMEMSQPKTTLHLKLIHHFLTTDAADFGWGAQMDDQTVSGKWRKDQMQWHCNRKEMFAIIAAIRHFRRHLILQSDNRTVISYIQKEGGTRSIALLNQTYQLLNYLDKWDITMTAEYIPGKFNDIADRLSRGKQAAEWHLLKPALNVIFRRFGVPQIDLFATKETRVVQNYVSNNCQDSSALFCNAFSRPWRFQLAWVFPPPSLIPRVLQHLNTAQGTFLIVAPMWKRVFWLPDLRRRALCKPLKIQRLSQVLVDHTTGLPPSRIQDIKLFVWKIGAGKM